MIKAELDWVLEDMDKAKAGDSFLLHSCAHNPTGCDLSKEDWHQVCDQMARKKLIPIFDTAYQGFATGDLEQDSYAIRHFASQGLPVITIQS